MGPLFKFQAVQEEFRTTNQCFILYGKVLAVIFCRGGRVSQVAGVCSGYQGVGVRIERHQSKVDKMKKLRRRRYRRSEKMRKWEEA